MTLGELRRNVNRRLREQTVNGAYFSAVDVDEAINAGYMELSDASEWNEEFIDFELLRFRPFYDLFAIIGSGFLSVKPMYDPSRHRWMIPTPVRELDNHDTRWERVVGPPQRQFTRGLRWTGFYPRIDTDGDLARQYYTRLPKRLVDEDDEPGFPDAFHVGCEHFAVADLLGQDAETKLALSAWTAYEETEQALIGWVQARISRPIARAMGKFA